MTSAPDHRMSASSTKSIRKLRPKSWSGGGSTVPATGRGSSLASATWATSRPSARPITSRTARRLAEGGAWVRPSLVISGPFRRHMQKPLDSITRDAPYGVVEDAVGAGVTDVDGDTDGAGEELLAGLVVGETGGDVVGGGGAPGEVGDEEVDGERDGV